MFKVTLSEKREVKILDVLEALGVSKKIHNDTPKPLSEKAIRVKNLLKGLVEPNNHWFKIISELLGEDIAIDKDVFFHFKKFTPIIPLRNTNGHNYIVGDMIFYNCDRGIFYKNNGVTGNAMDPDPDSWRFATEEEVYAFFEKY